MARTLSKRLQIVFSPFIALFLLAVPIICDCPSLIEKHEVAKVLNQHHCHHEESSNEAGNSPSHHHQACICSNAPTVGLQETVEIPATPLSMIGLLQPVFEFPTFRRPVTKYFPSYHSPPESEALYLIKSSFLI